MTMQTTWAKSKARSGKWRTRAESVVSLTRRPLIFNCLVVFFALYYYRPEDLIRALAYIPMAKISGGLAFVALLASMLGGGKFKVPAAVKILWLLLVQMTLCIPLAMWPGALSTRFSISLRKAWWLRCLSAWSWSACGN
jgi:hypothetical protein